MENENFVPIIFCQIYSQNYSAIFRCDCFLVFHLPIEMHSVLGQIQDFFALKRLVVEFTD